MLRRVMPKEQEGDWVAIKDAAFPVPFAHGLEYNSPAHGPWNIVHMGMQVPGSHHIYVCGANCVRGVVLTAAEMNAIDRFSTISIEEEDLFRGDMEDHIVRCVEEILEKLPYHPTAIFLFTVCVHHFMGCDIPYIYRSLRERNPEYTFVECYMDPIMQKEGLTPDQKLRDAMMSLLPDCQAKEKRISFVGSDFTLDEESEIFSCFQKMGWQWQQGSNCQDYEEYQKLSESSLMVVTYPLAQYGGQKLCKRLGRDYLYLPQVFSYEEIGRQYETLARAMGVSAIESDKKSITESGMESDIKSTIEAGMESAIDSAMELSLYIEKCESVIERARNLIGDTEIAIDMNAIPRYLSLARFLVEHGFNVTRVYGDAFSGEDQEAYEWLKEHAPELRVYPTIQARMRLLHGNYGCKVLGIGQKAAYFTGSPYFVNVVEGGSYYGIHGIMTLMEDMMEAFKEPKDLTIVSHKGLGCECCL